MNIEFMSGFERDISQIRDKKLAKIILSRFSAHLFWDINPKDMDAEKHKQFIVQRVLQYGLMSDWILLRESLEIKEIADIAAGIKDLDPKSCSFISLLANKPKEEFLCYSTKQSIPAHWNF
jgi:hypothetical protein